MSNLITGDVIFYRNIKTFLSRVQQWVLRTDLSHVSVVSGYHNNSVLELEADEKVRLHTLLKDWLGKLDGNHRQVFRWNGEYVPLWILYEAVDKYRHELEGTRYGFIQWLTIGIRTFLEWILSDNRSWKVKSWNILWGWGTVCSELVRNIDMEALKNSADHWKKNNEPYKRLMCETMYRWYSKYNKDTITPKDIRDGIYKSFPQLIKDITNEVVQSPRA